MTVSQAWKQIVVVLWGGYVLDYVLAMTSCQETSEDVLKHLVPHFFHYCLITVKY